MSFVILFSILFSAIAFAGASDCSLDNLNTRGPYDYEFINITQPIDGVPALFGYLPKKSVGRNYYPVTIFMHGMTLGFEFYSQNLQHYASHGYNVLFPFVKGVSQDDGVFPIVTQTNGLAFIKTIEWLHNASCPIAQRVDLARIAFVGHSMGGEDVIKAASKLPNDTATVLIAQHPGLCGPFGPPPYPDTYNKKEMQIANMNVDAVYLITSVNDRAFRGPKLTPAAELSCFNYGNRTGLFASFATPVCSNYPANITAATQIKVEAVGSGHMCSCCATNDKTSWQSPETKWVTAMLHLHLSDDFQKSSPCYELLWGDSNGSMRQHSDTANVTIRI